MTCLEGFWAGIWLRIYFQVWLGWKMLQPWKANSVFPLHTTWDVSPDCSKVTPSTQTLPSLVGAHNNTLPSPPFPLTLPSCLSILFVYSAACLELWLVHPHLLHSYPQTWHRQASTTVSFLPLLLIVCGLNRFIVIVDYCWFTEVTNLYHHIFAFCGKKPHCISWVNALLNSNTAT